ncbi:hypothetical protein Taro_044697 [Colocasia esculenta]|uniref:Uncharacterized protein n=1 Tax=Colocasia esculenta TaxID=4460 RepID=A0A843WUN7_COLES|nr:hypothetical protein [Colocasia esculenta]
MQSMNFMLKASIWSMKNLIFSRRVTVGNATPRLVAFWGPEAKRPWPGSPFPFFPFSFPSSPLRREVFFLPSPAVELDGVAGGSYGAWSIGEERGGGGRGVVKTPFMGSLSPCSPPRGCVVVVCCGDPGM